MDLTAEVGGKGKLASPDLAVEEPGSGFLIFGRVDETEAGGVARGELDG